MHMSLLRMQMLWKFDEFVVEVCGYLYRILNIPEIFYEQFSRDVDRNW